MSKKANYLIMLLTVLLLSGCASMFNGSCFTQSEARVLGTKPGCYTKAQSDEIIAASVRRDQEKDDQVIALLDEISKKTRQQAAELNAQVWWDDTQELIQLEIELDQANQELADLLEELQNPRFVRIRDKDGVQRTIYVSYDGNEVSITEL